MEIHYKMEDRYFQKKLYLRILLYCHKRSEHFSSSDYYKGDSVKYSLEIKHQVHSD